MTDAQWAFEALVLDDVEAAEKRAREEQRAWLKALLVKVTGTALMPPRAAEYDDAGQLLRAEDDGIVGLGILTGHRELMSKILAQGEELAAEERAASDTEFDAFSRSIQAAAEGRSVSGPEARLARLLTDDHAERERAAGRVLWEQEVARAGITLRDPRLPGADVDRLERARGTAGGLLFDDDIEAAYSEAGAAGAVPFEPADAYARLAHARATGGSSMLTAEEARAAGAPVPGERAASLEEQAFAADLDPATTPLEVLAHRLNVPAARAQLAAAPGATQPPSVAPGLRFSDDVPAGAFDRAPKPKG